VKRNISNLKHKLTILFIKKRNCCSCHEIRRTNLELEDGKYICETCAQIISDLAN